MYATKEMNVRIISENIYQADKLWAYTTDIAGYEPIAIGMAGYEPILLI